MAPNTNRSNIRSINLPIKVEKERLAQYYHFSGQLLEEPMLKKKTQPRIYRVFNFLTPPSFFTDLFTLYLGIILESKNLTIFCQTTIS